MRTLRDFHGGVQLPENKQQTAGQPIGEIPLPEELIVSLKPLVGPQAYPLINVGDKVLKGQLIAELKGPIGTVIHAPSSGEIIAIELRPAAHPSGLTALSIVIKTDGLEKWCELNPSENPETLDTELALNKIRAAGLVGLGGAGYPTANKLEAARSLDANKMDTFIVNGCESEPYLTCDDRLMREHADNIIQGALVLSRIMGDPKNIIIAIENNKTEAITSLRNAARDTTIEVVEIPTKYPSGGEKQLIQILTGKEVPSGSSAISIGVFVQNVATVFAAWRAVRFGEPLIERIVTVAGEAITRPHNIRVLVGTPIRHIFNQLGFKEESCARIIIGGPMMGFAITDISTPVASTTSGLLAPSLKEMPDAPPAQACIRCGLCAEVCPAQLLPQQLFWNAKNDDYEKLQSHNLKDCIECGACSYVCPSAIPLVQYYRIAKVTIGENELAKQRADRARERFELRKARIARADAEKEVKRQARKHAAELAKEQLKAQKENLPEPTAVTDTASNDSERKKIERTLISAKDRLTLLENQLAESSQVPARAERIKAQIKQAQVKLQETKNKLDALDRGVAMDLPTRLHNMAERVKATPYEAQQKAVETLRKRLAVAHEKYHEAEQENRPTLDALRQGVEKLRDKLSEAQAELVSMQNDPQAHVAPVDAQASAIIASAQSRQLPLDSITPHEKLKAQIETLNTRINQTQMKLNQAISDNSAHADNLQGSLNKLKEKLKISQDSLNELITQDSDDDK